MLSQRGDPLISGKDMLPYLITCLVIEACLSLRLDHLLEEAGVDSANDVDEVLTRRSLLGGELVVQIAFDLRIVLHLLDESIHVKFTVVRQLDSVDRVVLEVRLLAPQKLTNELTVDILIVVEVTLTM